MVWNSDSTLAFGVGRGRRGSAGRSVGAAGRVCAGGREGKRGPRSDGRRFLNAVLWLARSGARWCDLPEDRFGSYQAVKRRYYRWIAAGVFDRIFAAVAADPDMEWLAIDATVIRAHAQAAGGLRKRGARKPRLSAVLTADTAPSCTSSSMPLACQSASPLALASRVR